MQDDYGQIRDSYSVSAGLDYPGVGPELAYWKESGRATFSTTTDAEALVGFYTLAQTEGIISGLESAHAIWGGMKVTSSIKEN